MMTPDYARACLDYQADSGQLLWRARPAEHFSDASYALRFNSRFAGKPAGNVSANGYLRINFNTKFYLAHRLIWLMTTDQWPLKIDHINGVRTDNRLTNLRAVDATENARNSRISRKNSSGVIGVSYDSAERRWHAYIGVGNSARRSLGYFKTKEEAAAARHGAERVLGYHENHGRAA